MPRFQLLDGQLYEVVSPGYHVQTGRYSTDLTYHAPSHRKIAWSSQTYWQAMKDGPVFQEDGTLTRGTGQ